MPKLEPIVTLMVDGINITASHFAKMDKKDAVAAMKADGILSTHGKTDKWAAEVYDKCKEKMTPDEVVTKKTK